MINETGQVDLTNVMLEVIREVQGRAEYSSAVESVDGFEAMVAGNSSSLIPPDVGKARKSNIQKKELRYESGAAIPATYEQVTGVDVASYRRVLDTTSLIRKMNKADGILSSAVTAMFRMAFSSYTIQGYKLGTSEVDSATLKAAEAIISRIDSVNDYSKGYSDRKGFKSLIEHMLLECALASGVGMEVVVDEGLFPDRFEIFAYDTIIWQSDGKGNKYPTQRPTKSGTAASVVSLDKPNIFVSTITSGIDSVYSQPIFASGINDIFSFREFTEDMRRVLRRAGIPRTVATLDYEKVSATAPSKIASDPEKLSQYLEAVRDSVSTRLSEADPDDVIVIYDYAKMDSIASKGEKSDYTSLLEALVGLAASAAKSNPAVLGLRLSAGSQNMASAETLIFMKICTLLQTPVEEILSRALTFAVRLLGATGYVKFSFRGIDLRPDSELEAFRTMRQSRVLELLSLGLVTDDEAQEMLELPSRPEGAELLAGTKFYSGKKMSELPTPNQDTHGRQVASNLPKSGGGKDNTNRV